MMDSDLAIHLSECLRDVDGINIDWRALKKYADDFEQRDWQRRFGKNE